MLKDRVPYYYNQCDCNCAETMLRCANDEWNLNLSADAYRAIAPFGGGCGCGEFCGAIAGSLAALGEMQIKVRAHVTEGFPELCAEFTQACEASLGSLKCEKLKEMYRTEEERCIKTVLLAAEVLQKQVESLNKSEE